jgi:ubiquinone/menaquinone biosynthesis C-methylase UbiE
MIPSYPALAEGKIELSENRIAGRTSVFNTDQPEPAPGAYAGRVQEEIEHYTRVFEDENSRRTLTQSVPPSWDYMEAQANTLICSANQGRSAYMQVVHHVQSRGGGRILSLGSGPGGQEMTIARLLGDIPYEFTCLDLNPQLVAMGQERANEAGMNFRFQVQDLNDLDLGEYQNQFDVIVCFASLHHLINLEHIFYEINRALTADGELVVADICTRNGYLMWDDSLAVVRSLWAVLPENYKINHTSYQTPQVDSVYENLDYGAQDMECVRSQDILPLLDHFFARRLYVPYFSIARRFFDTKYGPNYDLSQEQDKAIMDTFWRLDVHYLATGVLKPETFFGVYAKGPEQPRPAKVLPFWQPAGETPPTPAALAVEELDELRQMLPRYRRLRDHRLVRLLKPLLRWLR